MEPLDLFKLEKLCIEAYTDDERKTPADPASMDVIFNPTDFQEKHVNTYQAPGRQAINSSARPALYGYTPPEDIAFKFVFDGTGVNLFGAERIKMIAEDKEETVKLQIAKFKKLCLEMNGDIHQPNFLKIIWGEFTFSCRLASLNITYKLFDQSGDPLRAELDVSFVIDKNSETIQLEEGKNSPDLTHIRVVKNGDTLPLLTKDIYGSSKHYLWVAHKNNLNHFRNLTVGQKLHFPPLESEQGGN